MGGKTGVTIRVGFRNLVGRRPGPERSFLEVERGTDCLGCRVQELRTQTGHHLAPQPTIIRAYTPGKTDQSTKTVLVGMQSP